MERRIGSTNDCIELGEAIQYHMSQGAVAIVVRKCSDCRTFVLMELDGEITEGEIYCEEC